MGVRIIPARQDVVQETAYAIGPRKLRVGAYCRVSTDHEEQESSYESQQRHYRECIEAHPDWVLVDIYADEGLSGTNASKRDNFQRMIRDCERGRLDMVLTKSISRFARNTLDCLNYIRKLKGLGIPIVFEKEGINTLDAKGELLITIMASIAQQESQSISQNVRLGIQYNFQRGKPKLNYTCFLGYTKGPRDDKLTIVPEEADIVRRVFRDFIEGMSISEIAGALQREGVKTPGGKGKWYPSTVVSMIQNEKYQGDLLLQKTYTVDFLTKERRLNHGQLPQYLVENAHDPIVPREVFMIAQGEMLRRQAERYEDGKRPYTFNGYTLSGITRCGICGAPFRRHAGCGCGHTLWRCRTRSKDKACNAESIREEMLHDVVLEAINRLPEARDVLLRKDERIQAAEIESIIREMNELDKQQGEIEEALSGQGCMNGDSTETLQAELENLHIRYDALLTRRAELGIQKAQVMAALDLSDAICRRFTLDMAFARQCGEGKASACYDLDDFFRRTAKPLPMGPVEEYDDDLVRRFIERVTIYEDHVMVRFKAGVEIKVRLFQYRATA